MALTYRTEGDAQASTASITDENECDAKWCIASCLALEFQSRTEGVDLSDPFSLNSTIWQ